LGENTIFDSLSQYLGVVAGAFQLVGYLVYIRYFLDNRIRPNATSWIMFAYGTSLMLFLEWRSEATWELLLLPAVCAFMSLFVAGLCIKKGFNGPTDAFEKGAFGADVGLTAGYLGLIGTAASGPFFNMGFLVAGNLTTVTAFLPILRSTAKNPENEKAAPWVFWSIAYAFLVLSTLVATGTSSPALLLYPCVSLLLHGTIAVFALKTPKVERDFTDSSQTTYIAVSSIAGLGVFAGRDLAVNAPICVLQGQLKIGAVEMETGPNWIGIGNNMWIDPDLPLDHINHCCEPNAAFSDGLILRALRPIARDEEITMDYSTTEADPSWRMACACGVPTCRKTLTSIQIAFADATEAPPALPAMQKIWQKAKDAIKAQTKPPPRSAMAERISEDA
jgi:SET domain